MKGKTSAFKIIVKIILILLILFGLASIVLLLIGYRPLIADSVSPNWGVINTIINIIIPIGVSIVGLVLSHKEKNKKVNSHLYDKQYQLFLEIKSYFDNFISNKFSPIPAVRNLVASMPNAEFDDIKTRADLIFSKTVNDLLKKLNGTTYKIIEISNRMQHFADYLISINALDGDFKEVYEGFYNPEKEQYTEASLKSVSNTYDCVKHNLRLDSEEPRDYNYYDMFTERREMISSFDKLYKELLETMKSEMN